MSVPTQVSSSSRPQTATNTNANSTATGNANASSEAASKLADALDDFLNDVEKKFSNIGNEIMTKLDDMADRCDRLEQEMIMREASGLDNRTKSEDDLAQDGTNV